MPKLCWPLLLARASMRPVGLPIRRKSLGFFSTTVAGTGWAMAAWASSPYDSFLPLGPSTKPSRVRSVAASTFHCAAAAATSMARARAPSSRYWV